MFYTAPVANNNEMNLKYKHQKQEEDSSTAKSLHCISSIGMQSLQVHGGEDYEQLHLLPSLR